MNDAQCMVDDIMESMGERGHTMNMDMDVYYFKSHWSISHTGVEATLEYKPHWSISHTGV